jgi:pimeloyl-ACP methyl ester carboxylesterase
LTVDDVGEGIPALLLHGWPDDAAVFGGLAAHLRAAGVRCIAPDQRGCGRSDKPSSLDAYRVRELVLDAVAVLDDAGVDRAFVIGHDWGANIAWAFATFFPERVHRLAVLGVGHPTSFRSAGIEQAARSWYTLLFFHEGIGEAFLRRHDHEAIRTWLGHPDPAEVIERLESTGQLAAQLRWYRANIGPDAFVSDPPVLPPVQVPTLGLWFSRDFALGRRQMEDSAAYCANGFTFRAMRGGHWALVDDPEPVARELVTFLNSGPLS